MTAPFGRPATLDGVRAELLGRLGLDDSATAEDLAEAHETVELFLSSAPRHLGAWARSQASSADEAYALLTDPAALARTVALGARATRPDLAPDGPATPTVRRESVPQQPPAAQARTKGRRGKSSEAEVEPSDDELAELIASVTPSAHRDSVGTGSSKQARQAMARAQLAPQARPERGQGLTLRNRVTLVAAGLAVIAIVAFAGYRFGGGGVAASLPVASPAASASLDLAAVNAYMQKITANPKDTASLQGLADLYYGAADYASATKFLNQILAYDPNNERALLGLGAAAFNGGDSASAESAWKKVVSINAKSVEAHYDLGFLYLNLNDLVGVQREWQLVIQLDPGSDVAKNVQDHLDAIAAEASSSPAASTGISASSPAPAGSTAPSGSPAPTAAPTGSAQP